MSIASIRQTDHDRAVAAQVLVCWTIAPGRLSAAGVVMELADARWWTTGGRCTG
jgi:hypothetical protein